MPKNKPAATEGENAESILCRLSVVVLFLVLAPSIYGGVLKAFPSEVIPIMKAFPNAEPITNWELGSLLWGYPLLGWVVFLITVYVFGKYEEVSEKWFKFFNLDSHLSLWALPIGFGLLSWVVCLLFLQIPDWIVWLRSFFGT